MRKILALSILLGGCAHVPEAWHPNKNAATERMHQQVLEQLQNTDRAPASPAPELGAKLSDLQRVRPGKFEVYVFPKVSGQNRKWGAPEESYLGKPRAFEVSTIAENPCRQFIQRALFATLKPETVFPAALAQDGQRRCAILEFTDKRLKQLDRALLKPNDVLVTRLFIDDSYRVHGSDRVLHESAGRTRTVRSLNSDGEASFAGLSLFPVDLPSSGARYQAGNPAQSFPELDGVAIHQIRRHHLRGFTAPSCQGGTMSYNDNYGAPVKVGWCKGMPWPSYADNARFFSVTQPLTVGGAR